MSDHTWTCGRCNLTVVRTGDYSGFLITIVRHEKLCTNPIGTR